MRRGIGMWVTIAGGFAALAALALVARSCSSGGSEIALPAAAEATFAPPTETIAPADSPTPSPSASPAAVGTAGTRKSSGAVQGTSPRRSGAGPAAPAGRVVCPSGTVPTDVTDFSVAEDTGGIHRPGEREWEVDVRGTVTNNTARPIHDIHVVVTVYASNGRGDSETALISAWLSPGSSTTWRTNHHLDSEDRPHEKDTRARAASWSWGDAYAQCPT